jgi:phage terminase Nu1 subunit (DNA packaging protein)
MLQNLKNEAPAQVTETSDPRAGGINTAEAAKIIGVNPSTLNQWRVRGVGPRWYRPDYKRIMYHLADIEEFLRKRATSGGGE